MVFNIFTLPLWLLIYQITHTAGIYHYYSVIDDEIRDHCYVQVYMTTTYEGLRPKEYYMIHPRYLPVDAFEQKAKSKGCLHNDHALTAFHHTGGGKNLRASLFAAFVYNTTVSIMGSSPSIPTISSGMMYPIISFHINPYCTMERVHLEYIKDKEQKYFNFYAYNDNYYCQYKVDVDDVKYKTLINKLGVDPKNVNLSSYEDSIEFQYTFSSNYPRLEPKIIQDKTTIKHYMSPRVILEKTTKDALVYDIKCNEKSVKLTVEKLETDSSDDVVISDVQGEIIAFYRENHIDPCKDEPILSLDKDNKKDYIVNRKDLFIKSEKTYHTLKEYPFDELDNKLKTLQKKYKKAYEDAIEKANILKSNQHKNSSESTKNGKSGTTQKHVEL